jgi:hypothetical protein
MSPHAPLWAGAGSLNSDDTAARTAERSVTYQFGDIESLPFWLVVRRVRFVPSGLMR